MGLAAQLSLFEGYFLHHICGKWPGSLVGRSHLNVGLNLSFAVGFLASYFAEWCDNIYLAGLW